MRHTKHVSKTRTVMYSFDGQHLAETLDCERVLAAAKTTGVITNYDDGRDRNPWFEAPPGADARALRDQFVAAGYVVESRARHCAME